VKLARGLLFIGLVGACSEIREAPSDGNVGAPDGSADGDGGGPASSQGARTDASSDLDATDAEPVSDGAIVRPDAASGKDAAPDAPGTCTGSCPPQVLADNQPQATVVIVDANNVYWGTEGTNGVWQCPKTGCAATPIKLASIDSTGLAVDAKRVYFGDFSGGKLLACAIGGCQNQPAVLSAAEPEIESVTTDGINLYWASNGNIRACALPCSGGTGDSPHTLYAQGGFVLDVTADQGNVFWPANGKMWVCNAASCTPTALGPGVGAGSFATHGRAYWVASPNSVVACEAGGCGGAPRTIGSSYSPQNVVSDDVNVYWRDDVSGDILRCPTSGCGGASATYQRHQQGQPGGKMATDGLYLYWATASRVLRAPK
jgi:hypothetical protein